MEKAAPIRRIVTGHDASGTAVVVEDGAAPNQRFREAARVTSTLVWIEDETPADNSGVSDKSLRETGVAPPDSGSIFRIVDFPPEADAGAFDNAAMKAEMGLDGADAKAARHPGMHRTRSVDYAIVMSGEIDMLLDESEVHLKAGDVVVQRGTNHAWANRGAETCRIAFVLIDAKEL
jgi:mannose-6-phosphate isomerase-like protein (cupin superfamily)